MLAPEIADTILKAGAQAPSGDNLQPWRVRWQSADAFLLEVDPERDRSLYNFQRRASLIALGAMIENMVIAARERGFETAVALRDAPDRLLSATLTFARAGVTADPLFRFIATRCTNRRPYERRPLAPGELDVLRASVPADGQSDLRFYQDPAEIRTIARAASLNDRLLFEIKALHERFFENVRWTESEAERTRDGLFVKTLELGPMAPGFRAMQSWRLTRALNLVGSSLFAPNHSYQTFLRSPAMGFLQMADTSPRAFLEGGRRIQRVWLTATSLGLAVQPMAGMLYLLNYLAPDATSGITESQRATIQRGEALFKRVLPLDDRKATIMAFRIGRAPAPSALSLRRPAVSRKP